MLIFPLIGRIISQLRPLRFGTVFSRFKRLWIVFAACLILHACTLLQVTYNQSPELIYWWLDDHVDFESAQSEQIRTDLKSLQIWHRQTQLNTFANLLQRMSVMAQDNITGDQVCAVVDEARNTLPALISQIEPIATRLAQTVKVRQLRQMERKYRRSNKTWRAEWMDGTPEERLSLRVDKGLEQSQRFYGRLDSTQRALLAQMATESPFNADMSYTERQRRQNAILSLIQDWQKEQSSKDVAQDQIRALLQSLYISTDEKYKNYAQQQLQYNCMSVAKLHNATTPAQKTRAVKTLKGYENDLRELMAQK
jgi:hypothetical protein